jgi:hypothetical protein
LDAGSLLLTMSGSFSTWCLGEATVTSRQAYELSRRLARNTHDRT